MQKLAYMRKRFFLFSGEPERLQQQRKYNFPIMLNVWQRYMYIEKIYGIYMYLMFYNFLLLSSVNNICNIICRVVDINQKTK